MTTPHDLPTSADEPTHPWAAAWAALSPQRRAALHGRVVDREPIAELATRLERSEQDTEALVASTLVAFRREVVLGIGTGYADECGSLVLRLVDSAGEKLSRADRKALATHADTCPECARAVGELLELDARLRDGLIQLVGTDAPAAPAVAAVSVPAPRTGTAPVASPTTPDTWAPAFERLSAERRTALVHGAAGAEPASDLATRLGTTEPAARALAASSVLAFRQTVLRDLPVGSGADCELVAVHRTDDVALDAARVRGLKAHAASCTDCAPTVAEILALHESLRPRVAGLALGAEAVDWLKTRPRRSWVPGVERPAEPVERRRRIGIGAGLAVAAVTAFGLVVGLQGSDTTREVAAAETPLASVEDGSSTPSSPSTEETGTDGRGGREGSRSTPRTPVAVDAATEAAQPSGGVRAPEAGPVGPVDPGPEQPGDNPGDGPGGDPDGPGGGPDGPGEDPDTPPLGVAVDSETGSITVTVGLLGDPIVISTPPITVNNR